jgi:hypothetical protein
MMDAAKGGPDQDGIWRAAAISPDGVYRWWLTRRWSDSGGAWVHFLMLNPSTADADMDDATIRRVTRFARDWGFIGLVVTNLFAYRATDPDDLWHWSRSLTMTDRLLHESLNDEAFTGAARLCSYTVCAWGADRRAQNRGQRVLEVLRAQDTDIRALRVSASGAPWHPLYLPARTMALPYGSA